MWVKEESLNVGPGRHERSTQQAVSMSKQVLLHAIVPLHWVSDDGNCPIQSIQPGHAESMLALWGTVLSLLQELCMYTFHNCLDKWETVFLFIAMTGYGARPGIDEQQKLEHVCKMTANPTEGHMPYRCCWSPGSGGGCDWPPAKQCPGTLWVRL